MACPAEFVARVSAAFTADGVADVQGHPHLPVAPPLPPVSPLPAPLPPPPPPMEGLTQGGILSIILGVIVLFVMYLVWGRCQCNICTKCPRSNSRPGQGSSVPDVTQVATKRVRGSFGASRASGGAYNASYGAPPAAPRGEVGNGVSAGVGAGTAAGTGGGFCKRCTCRGALEQWRWRDHHQLYAINAYLKPRTRYCDLVIGSRLPWHALHVCKLLQ